MFGQYRSFYIAKLLMAWSVCAVLSAVLTCSAKADSGDGIFVCPSLPDVSDRFPYYYKPDLSGIFRVLRHDSQLLGGPLDCHFRHFIPAPSGRTISIMAAGDGDIVVAVGRLVVVRYRSGLTVGYGRLQKTKVVTGSKVRAGDELGLLPCGFKHRPMAISLGKIRVYAQ